MGGTVPAGAAVCYSFAKAVTLVGLLHLFIVLGKESQKSI